MFTSLNSPQQLTGWTASNGDPCGQSWKGVTCSGQRVTEIKLSNLGLSGSIGYNFQSLTSLKELDMSHNSLAGDLPYNIPQNLQRLNLAFNQFTGGIPYYFNQMYSLQYLNLGHNQLQNQLSDIFGQLSSLSTLDLSFNSLTGDLPESFKNLTSMNSMYLQNNQFTGIIGVLANLPLDTLYISNNHFTGWIPDQLKSINLQKDGNSWSSGPAPPPPPGTPPATRNNRNHNSGTNSSPSDGVSGGGSSKSGIGGGGIAGIVVSILVVGAIVAFFLVKRRSRRSSSDIEKLDNQPFAPLASKEVQEMKSIQSSSSLETKTFDKPASINLRPPPIDRHKSFDEEEFSKKPIVVKKAVTVPANVTSYSIADLQMATDSFSVENLLGEGSFGRVYRAQFDDGKVLAVKKVDSSALPSAMSDEFIEIVSNISHLHHTNVTELVGYCSEHGQHLLVYEFHKNGSLHDFLHLSEEYSKPLIWNSRVKIALGTARAIEYLHEACSPSVVHKNIKSANILLDAELNPHLSDSGLATFIPNAEQVLNRDDLGSGYSAPEVTMSGQYSLKSDVYSFGVVMLELLTGRKPFDSTRPRLEQSLVRWATPQLHDIDALSKMVDPALKGLYPVKSLSRFADVIALCVQPEPEFRPPMSEVVQALVRLVQRANMSRRTIGTDQGASPRTNNPDDTHDYMS
ncbi:protein STRUBBELIG-RECEPTOR FAMILY 6-like isoform X3 [Durio zibethinus]|nr:protein STRUBBELIG-RECEPTOR FAMILY 6-like isoform X3 [Durio zibethinus]XP_022721667.1 protein STRUBBELIG-RECEPTOR FAMILY 6-like isoform X3 [Durio zibethinus]XP_022721668.1 protein STRUBBELIG-RECEPTOR FAMILY 6-like isoform X3 [Durio zibethinus]XP_022721670.1 protein STRUBBELIG-RECEPTOR FAMILY 6-like isoform X3 [Durio zibethinus]